MRDIDETKAPLIEHLIELRQRLLWSVVARVAVLRLPVLSRSRSSASWCSPCLRPARARSSTPTSSRPSSSQVKVALFAALMLGFPFFAIQMWQFVAPGLYARRRKRSCRSCC